MRNKGHVRQRSKGSFELRYSIGRDPITGKRLVKSKTLKGTRKQALRELKYLIKSLKDNTSVEQKKITTVVEFLNLWIDTVTSEVSPKTHDRYNDIVRNFLIPKFGKTLLTQLAPLQIQTVYNGWLTSGRRDKKAGGLAPRTRLHIHRIFKSAIKHAVKMRLITSNPVDDVKAPRAKKVISNTLSVEQTAQMLNFFRERNPRLFWPVFLAVATGMRRGEIVALRWKNIDFSTNTVHVLESIEQVKQNLRFKAPKTDRTRAVVLPDYAAEELKVWKEQQKKEIIQLGNIVSEDTFVCGRSWDGGVIKPNGLTGCFYRAIRHLSNFPIIRFHDLRHTHATQLLKQKVHPKIAQERLGHSTITTTMDMYSHVIETMQAEAVAKLDAVYRPVLNLSRPINCS